MTQRDREQKVTDAYNMLLVNLKRFSAQEAAVIGLHIDQDKQTVKLFGSYERF